MSQHPQRRRRWLVVAAFAVSFIVSWYGLGRALAAWQAVKIRSHSRAAAPRDEESRRSRRGLLRIAAFNIAHGRGTAQSNWGGGDSRQRLARLKEIAQFLRWQRLDVVVLNEVDFDSAWSGGVNQAEFLARAAGFPYWAEQRNFDVSLPFCRLRFGNALLSRHPIRAARRIRLPPYSRWESALAGQKHALLCEIEKGPGSPIRVMAIHLEYRDEATRIASARRIRELMAADPRSLICAGDFNSSPPGFPHANPDSHGDTAMSLLQNHGLTTGASLTPSPATLTFPSANPDQQIDWILASRPWRFASYQAPPIILSDHRPVVAELTSDR